MESGVLFLKKTFHGHTVQELHLPIFHQDRDFVYSVLTDSMNIWKQQDKKNSADNDHLVFYKIADAVGRERTKSQIFIGPESIPYENLELIISNRPYVFTVDFEEQKIILLK